jgi:hypothetical protein
METWTSQTLRSGGMGACWVQCGLLVMAMAVVMVLGVGVGGGG